MATVRIYKVAELLGTTSQEVLALLKRDHGIELKSASSTLEEVVARSFVERVARQRNIALPGSGMFDETHHAPVKGGKKGAAAKKPEPPRPAAPVLGPPRLIKAAKALHQQAAAQMPDVAPAPEHEVEYEEAEEAATVAETPAPEPVEEAPAEPSVAEPPVEETPQSAAAAITPEPAAPAAAPSAPPRIVPSTLRLRIEEPGTMPRSAAATGPAKRPQVTQPRMTQPPPATPPAARPATPPAGARPGAPGPRPGAPGAPRPPYGSPAARPAPAQPYIGGPRPLPSQPVRPSQPGMPPRPGMPGSQPRPGGSGGRPPMGRPGMWSRPTGPRRDSRPQAAQPMAPAPPPPVTRTITLAEGMTVKDLADKLEVRVKDVLAKLLMRRMMMTINSTIDQETALSIAREFGADVQMRSFEEELIEADTEDSNPEDRVARAPVVTVMGHVDHGKTTLLDSIRETRVAEREAGGITQHIGAYHVKVGDRSVVFLDTPGHEAFTLMRARGAKVTDVVVLVVAADDGVMPQTREAIDHARAAGVPIVVAVNKIDKPDANPDNVKRELSDLGLMPEDWGGTTVMVNVSAKKKQNLDQLLEMILLSSDILELRANPKRSATGAVLEAKLDRGRGPVATVLVQDGTLRVGDNFIAGTIVGKVRALIDDRGRPIKTAGPSTPVEVLGLTALPSPGDSFQVVDDPAKARQIAMFRQGQAKDKALGAKGSRLTLESLKEAIAEGGIKELPIIVKADVQGSAEVVADTLAKLSDDKVKIRIIRAGVGAINESDVLLASASNAIVIGFNVRPDRNAADVAEREEVDIRHHTIIYKVTEEMQKAMTGLLEPTFKEVRIGAAQVRDTFKVPKFGTIAGCMVTEGRITRSGDVQARLTRDGVQVWEGKIVSLRRFKDDASEVKQGFECGIGLDRFNDVKPGDMIEVFQTEKVTAPA